jgi:hypothetical protein
MTSAKKLWKQARKVEGAKDGVGINDQKVSHGGAAETSIGDLFEMPILQRLQVFAIVSYSGCNFEFYEVMCFQLY